MLFEGKTLHPVINVRARVIGNQLGNFKSRYPYATRLLSVTVYKVSRSTLALTGQAALREHSSENGYGSSL